MLYGSAKARQIARSILPSRKRHSARVNAALVKRRNRRNTRQILHTWALEDNAYDFEGFTFDYSEPAAGTGWYCDISDVVSDRREGDNLGALLRWAPAVTAHLDDPEDRYNHIKALMPDNLIGRHALSHVAGLDGFEFGDEFGRWRYRRRVEVLEPMHSSVHVARLLREVIANGNHRAWNRAPRDVKNDLALAGLHDIERVARIVSRDPSTWDLLRQLS